MIDRQEAREALIEQLRLTSEDLTKKVSELYTAYQNNQTGQTRDQVMDAVITNSDILRGLAVYALSQGGEPNQEGTGAFISGIPVLFGDDEDADKRIHLGVVNNGTPVLGADIDGNVFMGSDIKDPSTTAWALFAIAQTYNSEDMGAGDILFGDNSSGKANVLWDVSEGQLKFRGGTTVAAYIDTDGTLVTTQASIGGWDITAASIEKLVSGVGIVLDSANQIIKVGDTAGTHIQIDGANKRIRSSNYVAGATGFNIDADNGDAEFGKITARGEMLSAVMVNTAVGETLLVLPADVLDVDMTAADASTLTIKGKITLAVGDILWMKDEADEEWLEVTSIASAPTYSVTRDKAAAYGADANPAWKAGQAVINYMQSGDGGIKIESGASPKVSCFTHAGSPWSSITEETYIDQDGVWIDATATLPAPDQNALKLGDAKVYQFDGTTNKYLYFSNAASGSSVIRRAQVRALNSASDCYLYLSANDGGNGVGASLYVNGAKIEITEDGTFYFNSLAGKAFRFNPNCLDVDFVINGSAGTLFDADSGLDAVGIGGAAASGQKLKVTGAVTITGALTLNTAYSHTNLADKGTNTHAQIDTHIGSTSNPHSVTAAQASAVPTNGWIEVSATWTRTGNYTFTISGDVTATYRKGTKVRYKDGGSYEYGVVISSSYSSPNTTVTLATNDDYAMAAATITDTAISFMENPEGFPDTFNYTPTVSASAGSITNPSITTAKFSISATRLKWWHDFTCDLESATALEIRTNLPITPAFASAFVAATRDASSGVVPLGIGVVGAAIGAGYRLASGSNWSIGTTKRMYGYGEIPF